MYHMQISTPDNEDAEEKAETSIPTQNTHTPEQQLFVLVDVFCRYTEAASAGIVPPFFVYNIKIERYSI